MSFEPHYINTYIIQVLCLILILNIIFICIEKLYKFDYSLRIHDTVKNKKNSLKRIKYNY
jgi:hypothetical protein